MHSVRFPSPDMAQSAGPAIVANLDREGGEAAHDDGDGGSEERGRDSLSRSNRYFQQHSTAFWRRGNTRPHVGGEAMSVKAERPLKDAIEATFVEVPRKEASSLSVGPRMARMKAARLAIK